MIENGMVMPTDVNFDRKRQRKVVFYGRVSYKTFCWKRWILPRIV